MSSIKFTLKDAQKKFVDRLIKAGDYQNEEEIINAALALLEKNSSDKLKRLRSQIDEGLNSGSSKFVDEDKLLKELKAWPTSAIEQHNDNGEVIVVPNNKTVTTQISNFHKSQTDWKASSGVRSQIWFIKRYYSLNRKLETKRDDRYVGALL